MTEFLTAAQAARRLGVKPATLYAYVSRGVLRRDKAADGRGSLFDPDEVERLARRGRPRRPTGVADITVESAITEISGDRLRYRGLDVIRLAVSHSFEEVAELLWTGALPSVPAAEQAPWRATPAGLAAGRGAQAALPAGTLPLERLQVIVPAMAATDPLRLLPYIPLYTLTQMTLMRVIRLIAIVQEVVLRSSYRDPYVPARVMRQVARD